MHIAQSVWSLIAARSADGALVVPQRRAERLLAGTAALLVALALCAVWGMAATPLGLRAAAANAFKVPMLVLVSGLTCLPAFVLACRLAVARSARAADLLTAYGVSVLAAGLVLGALAPIVALYQHSSAWAGPGVALGSAVLAFGAGVVVFLRALGRLADHAGARTHHALAAAVLVIGHILALSQLSSTTSSVFAKRSVFGQGVDALHQVHDAHGKEAP